MSVWTRACVDVIATGSACSRDGGRVCAAESDTEMRKMGGRATAVGIVLALMVAAAVAVLILHDDDERAALAIASIRTKHEAM